MSAEFGNDHLCNKFMKRSIFTLCYDAWLESVCIGVGSASYPANKLNLTHHVGYQTMSSATNTKRIIKLVEAEKNSHCRHDNEKEIQRNKLVNRLNYINFQDSSLLVNFRHRKYSQTFSLEAKPFPCEHDRLDCSWVQGADIRRKLASSTFVNFVVADGHRLVVVEPTVVSLDHTGISFQLPETCRELTSRRVKRHSCPGIAVQLSQNSAHFHGRLCDFNAEHFPGGGGDRPSPELPLARSRPAGDGGSHRR